MKVKTRHHNLKLFNEFFQVVVDCDKKSEIRFNDRNYQVGDTITLHEGYLKEGVFSYSGRTVSARISHVSRNYGLQDGYVCLSLTQVGMLVIT